MASFRNVKGAVLRSPPDPVITIDREQHIVSEAAEFPPGMANVAGRGQWVVADVLAQLDDPKFLGGDPPNQVILVEPAGQNELA